MDGRKLKFVALGTGVILSMAFLIWAGIGGPEGMVYYLTVSEFMEQETRETDGFRVNGKVVHGTIERMTSGQDVMFAMSDGDEAMRVSYHGIIPDTFVDGADVVVEGRLQDNGTFVAHTMLAKCPSKYESADEYEQYEQERDGAPAAPVGVDAANAG
ncbi:cytochrome c maturation protein CcmE [bacterium]|nr:cytochrome c maturation protein CcmE [bacterium]